MVWTIIIILLSAADQLLKALVNQNIAVTDRITVIDRFFYLINRKNRGAAWSFLANQDWGIYILAAISGIVTIVLLIVLYRTHHKRLQACLTLIIAGSIGNFIDRVRDLAVTDYLDFHFGSYVFPTFNLADMLVVCGTILLSFLILFDPHVADLIIFKSGKPSADLAESTGSEKPSADLAEPPGSGKLSAGQPGPTGTGKDGEPS